MKEIDGAIIIEPNDCVQVVKGQDIGTIGIVISTQGSELLCWGRTPASVPGTMAFTFKVNDYECMYIGKGRIRPKSKAEEQQAIPEPKMPQGAVRSLSGAKTPPQPQTPPTPRTAPRPAPSPAPSAAKPAFGVDSESIDLRPRPTKGDDVNPEMLKPVVFAGPNAREMHGRPTHPEALRTEQTQVSVEPPQTQTITPTQNEQPRPQPEAPKKKVQRKNIFRKNARKGNKRRASLGIPVEGTSGVPGEDSLRQASPPPKTQD